MAKIDLNEMKTEEVVDEVEDETTETTEDTDLTDTGDVEEPDEEAEDVDEEKEDEEEPEDTAEKKEVEPLAIEKEESDELDPDDILNVGEKKDDIADLKARLAALEQENQSLKAAPVEEEPDFMKITDEELEEMALDNPHKAMKIQIAQLDYKNKKEQAVQAQKAMEEQRFESYKKEFKRQANVASMNLLKKAGFEPTSPEGIKIRKLAAEIGNEPYFKHIKDEIDGNLKLIAIAGFSLMGDLMAEQKKKLSKKAKKINPRKSGLPSSGINSHSDANYNKGRVSIGI